MWFLTDSYRSYFPASVTVIYHPSCSIQSERRSQTWLSPESELNTTRFILQNTVSLLCNLLQCSLLIRYFPEHQRGVIILLCFDKHDWTKSYTIVTDIIHLLLAFADYSFLLGAEDDDSPLASLLRSSSVPSFSTSSRISSTIKKKILVSVRQQLMKVGNSYHHFYSLLRKLTFLALLFIGLDEVSSDRIYHRRAVETATYFADILIETAAVIFSTALLALS